MDIPTLFAKTFTDKYGCIVEIDTGFSQNTACEQNNNPRKNTPEFHREKWHLLSTKI